VSRAQVRCLALSLLLLSASACGEDPLAPEEQALTNARARWEAAGPSAYSYHYRLSCFCPPQLLETARVSVSDGQVTAVHLVDSDEPASPDTYDLYETVEGLFERLAVALASDPAVFQVTYDGALGYPTSARVDISEQIADEEYSFTASDLVPATS
jgi:hypothetical protein